MVVAAGAASASVFLPLSSNLTLKFGGLPTIVINGSYANSGTATLSIDGTTGGSYEVALQVGVFQAVGFSPVTTLFTGTPALTDLQVTATNPSLTFVRELPGGGLTAIVNPSGTVSSVTTTTTVTEFAWRNKLGGGNAFGATTANGPSPSISGVICGTQLTSTATGTPTRADGCIGGIAEIGGQSVLQVGLPIGFAIPLGKAAGGNATTTANLGILGTLMATGAPFVTGKVVVTGVNTNLISTFTPAVTVFTPANRAANPNGPGGIGYGFAFTLDGPTENNAKTRTTKGGTVFNQASSGVGNPIQTSVVAVEGTNALVATGTGTSGDPSGTITLVAPSRIDIQALIKDTIIPGLSSMKLTFVPEPGTMLLLASGAAGLVLIGRRRMRK
jgi:hypothetical protein